MRQRSKRLAVVESLAQRREEECAKALGICIARVKEAEDKLLELKGFMEDYTSQKRSIAEGRGGALALQNYVSFMGNLDQAISQQSLQLKNEQIQRDSIKQEWVRRHEKRKNLARLIDRYRREEDQESEKKLQKEIDDVLQSSNQGPSNLGKNNY
jgi:flagellar FliJ protein